MIYFQPMETQWACCKVIYQRYDVFYLCKCFDGCFICFFFIEQMCILSDMS